MKPESILSIVLAVALTSGSGAAEKAPNIVFLLVDDQRNTTLGCAGHPQIKTPRIDQLAAEGVRFENAFVHTPICMASRANIFTGLSTSTCGYHARQKGTVLKKDVATSFPTLLREAGYTTAFYGKQHVIFEKGVNGMKTMFNDHEVLHRNPFLKKMPDGSMRHVDDIIGDRSVDFVKAQTSKKPFMLYMSFNISHAEDQDRRPGYHYQWPLEENGLFEDIEPLRPDLDDPEYFEVLPNFIKKTINRDRYFWGYDTPEKFATNMRAYYRMMAGLDRIVGRVIDTLKEQGLHENTIIIYTADNGYYMGDRGLQGKWSHFDQSVHVPLIVYDPRIKKELRGRVLDQLISSLDFPATMLAQAGVPVPAKYQGVSILPLLEGETPADWRKEVFGEHHSGGPNLPHWYGVRDHRYTYANYYRNKTELIYDREKDPTELTNIAGDPEYKTILEDLRRRSDAYYQKYTSARGIVSSR